MCRVSTQTTGSPASARALHPIEFMAKHTDNYRTSYAFVAAPKHHTSCRTRDRAANLYRTSLPTRVATGSRTLIFFRVGARRCLTVDAVADRKPNQSLPCQLTDDPHHEDRRGRIADALHPEQIAGRGQGSQLAARSKWSDLSSDAALLAEDRSSILPPREGTWQPPGIKRVA
jgi:hypothetical protein